VTSLKERFQVLAGASTSIIRVMVMKTVHPSKTSVYFYETAQRQFLEGCHLLETFPVSPSLLHRIFNDNVLTADVIYRYM
jgi:hypothetical protein